MKILIDAHMLGEKKTGTERYWKNLILSIKDYLDPKKIYLYCNLPKEKLPKEFHQFNIYTPKYKNGFYRIFFGFNQAIKKIKPDLIHVQNFTPFFKTIPIINTIHDLCFQKTPNTFSLKSKIAYQLFFKHSINLSDIIICPSFDVKNSLINYFPKIKKEKIKVIYDAADNCFFYIKNKKQVKKYLKERFNLNKDYYLVVGEIQKRKNPKKIIDYFQNHLKKKKDILLVFVGPNKINLKQTDEIKIIGYVNDHDLNYLYNGAKALIYFSKCEGFGLPIIEALKTKTPIIDSNLKVFQEIKFNYKKSPSIFNWKNIAKKMIKIYQQIK